MTMNQPISYAKTPAQVICVCISDTLLDLFAELLPSTLMLEQIKSPLRFQKQLEQGLMPCDAVLFDSSVEDPIEVSQQVHSFDKTIPILILTAEANCANLRRTIMYSPLLGSDIRPWPNNDIEGLALVVNNVVERHQQRRKYLDTIATMQPRIGNLSLSQPEVSHYLDRLLNQAPIGVVSLDAQGCILALNRQATRLLGVNERDTLGVALVECITPEGRDRMLNMLARCAVAHVFGKKNQVFELLFSESQKTSLEASVSPVAYRAERRGYMVILQDVTERVRAETQREKNEAQMRTLSSALEQAADSVMITDEKRVITYVNPAFERLSGYKKEEVVGRKTHFLRSGAQDSSFYGELWDTISAGSVFRGVLVNRKKNGEQYHEEKTIAALRDTEGVITHYVSTGRDISERLQVEDAIACHQAELAHVSRLNTLGEMTSGLAHELNQPLCAITTYAQTCLRVIDGQLEKQQKLQYGLEQVIRQAELASGILKRLRVFARKRALPKRCVDLRDIVNEVATLSRSELTKNGISLSIEQRSDRLYVYADPIQIEQVFLNLLRNSLDAMIDLPAERKKLSVLLWKNDSAEVKASLSDSGHGCSAEVIERLFEPFYSTKSNGLGIGLGISQSIVESHGGRLVLEKNDSKGATFSFSLPAVELSADTCAAENEAAFSE